MAATPITPFTPYYTKGNIKWVWAPAVALKTAPARAEINLGTDVTQIVNSWDGWSKTANFIDIPNPNDRYTGKVPGGIEAADSSLTCYLNKAGVDARQLLPELSEGFMFRFDAQDIPGRLFDVFPSTVASHSKEFEMDGVPMVVISFAITSEPATNVTIPA
ncbi:hypothetical protein [Sphaerisporangium sp. TRM90804]|uniref:phage tail tube protein n=1 Tax=Sphaerisporangium sp. TRM90804 TaxID=3031113 RepID=UPI00244D5A6B|nr:hypothetical protein [Sphaerisporangium sp. TRM90804]MDH2429315.1 hypothetical protein [Sphaerisporangium sp. TRM90804]